MTNPINDVVWCALAPSRIHGIGVFAIRDIPKGTELAGGELEYPTEDFVLLEIRAIVQDHHSLLEFADSIPNPNYDAHLQCFMNHSATPNSDGRSALRDIRKGEEITEDYTKGERPLGPKAKKHFSFL